MLACRCHHNRHRASCPSSIEIFVFLGLLHSLRYRWRHLTCLIASLFRHLRFVPVLARMFCPSQSELLDRSRDWKTETEKHHYRLVSCTISPSCIFWRLGEPLWLHSLLIKHQIDVVPGECQKLRRQSSLGAGELLSVSTCSLCQHQLVLTMTWIQSWKTGMKH